MLVVVPPSTVRLNGFAVGAQLSVVTVSWPVTLLVPSKRS